MPGQQATPYCTYLIGDLECAGRPAAINETTEERYRPRLPGKFQPAALARGEVTDGAGGYGKCLSS